MKTGNTPLSSKKWALSKSSAHGKRSFFILLIFLISLPLQSFLQDCPCQYGRVLKWTNATGNKLWLDGMNWVTVPSPGTPYDTACASVSFRPRYCDTVLFEGGTSIAPLQINLLSETVVAGYIGQPLMDTQVCKGIIVKGHVDFSAYCNDEFVIKSFLYLDSNASFTHKSPPGCFGFNTILRNNGSIVAMPGSKIDANYLLSEKSVVLNGATVETSYQFVVGSYGDTLYATNGSKIIGSFTYGDHHFYLDSVDFYIGQFGYTAGAADVIKANYNLIVDSGHSGEINTLFPVMNGNVIMKGGANSSLTIYGGQFDLPQTPPKINGSIEVHSGTVYLFDFMQVKKLNIKPGAKVYYAGKRLIVNEKQ